jgi:DnaJ-domain-containing protein 1
MTDYFSLLGEPRRPWLDPDSLKKKFLTLTATAHPDRVHNSDSVQKLEAQRRYTELNQAYQQLRNPKERLQHLLELETGTKPQQVQQVPADVMPFFFEVSQLFKETDAFLIQKAKTSSPLLRVQLFETGQGWVEKLNALQQQISGKQAGLLERLKDEDARWVANTGSEPRDRFDALAKLEELYRQFSYFARWQSQLQEKIVQLSL